MQDKIQVIIKGDFMSILDDMTGEVIGEWTLFDGEWINVYLSDNSHLYTL